MKRLWLILFVLPLFAQNEYDITHLIKKNGIYIKKFSDEKVNGEVFRMFGDMKAPLGKMKDGKKEGKWVDWYENGQKEYEETYKNDKINGLSTTWYENGEKESEIKYKDDLITSEIEWSEDGKLSSEKEPQQKNGIEYDDVVAMTAAFKLWIMRAVENEWDKRAPESNMGIETGDTLATVYCPNCDAKREVNRGNEAREAFCQCGHQMYYKNEYLHEKELITKDNVIKEDLPF
jgi:hypothetical protein